MPPPRISPPSHLATGHDPERGHGGEHVLHVEHILVADGEHEQRGEERAGEEDELAGQQREHGRGGAQEGGGGAGGAGQARAQLVRQLVEVAQLQAGQEGPAARRRRVASAPGSRLSSSARL